MKKTRLALWVRLSGAVALGALFASACIYDPKNRCDPNEHLNSSEACVCDDGLVFQGTSCVPCGANEVFQSGSCACSDGYIRSGADGGACVPSGAGVACTPGASSSTCLDPTYDVCRDRGGGVGYCTKPCTVDTDCPHGFACDTTTMPTTCETSPVGQGDPCTSNSDCAGKDATYCETLEAHACLVSGCAVDNPLSCSEGFACCDLHSLGLAETLCIPEGKCPTAQ